VKAKKKKKTKGSIKIEQEQYSIMYHAYICSCFQIKLCYKILHNVPCIYHDYFYLYQDSRLLNISHMIQGFHIEKSTQKTNIINSRVFHVIIILKYCKYIIKYESKHVIIKKQLLIQGKSLHLSVFLLHSNSTMIINNTHKPHIILTMNY
jgi:hypothetical protein